jgi:hypothetical protein
LYPRHIDGAIADTLRPPLANGKFLVWDHATWCVTTPAYATCCSRQFPHWSISVLVLWFF